MTTAVKRNNEVFVMWSCLVKTNAGSKDLVVYSRIGSPSLSYDSKEQVQIVRYEGALGQYEAFIASDFSGIAAEAKLLMASLLNARESQRGLQTS